MTADETTNRGSLERFHSSKAAKRVFDCVCSALGLVVLSPLLAVTAIAVWMDSGRPILYKALRTGRHSVPFRLLKFRTMVVNAEKLGGTSTGKNDPRLTRIGRFLRTYKLDELPQLWNVLKGEMSMVGPRPEVDEYTRLYAGEEQLILSVRPGITDYASIQFVNLAEILGSEDVDRIYAEQVRPVKNSLRLRYVQEQSFFGDLKILLRTLLHMVKR